MGKVLAAGHAALHRHLVILELGEMVAGAGHPHAPRHIAIGAQARLVAQRAKGQPGQGHDRAQRGEFLQLAGRPAIGSLDHPLGVGAGVKADRGQAVAVGIADMHVGLHHHHWPVGLVFRA
jgi:hypothetical protein